MYRPILVIIITVVLHKAGVIILCCTGYYYGLWTYEIDLITFVLYHLHGIQCIWHIITWSLVY